MGVVQECIRELAGMICVDLRVVLNWKHSMVDVVGIGASGVVNEVILNS
jgi:hypothetical protein